MSIRPIVGVSTYLEPARWGSWDRSATLLPQSYVDAVMAAGGVPVLLPVGGDTAAAEVAVGAVDALVLTGGADVDPARYGERPHPATVSRPDRDAWELALVRVALAAGLPVLAICRGLQLLNVACGGTLRQHLPDELGHEEHQPGPGVFGASLVRIRPGSRLSAVLGADLEVACHHHQAVRAPGVGLRAVAWTGDGTVEAIEHPGHRFVVGVQWHPEEPPPRGEADGRLFRALVEAAGGTGAGTAGAAGLGWGALAGRETR